MAAKLSASTIEVALDLRKDGFGPAQIAAQLWERFRVDVDAPVLLRLFKRIDAKRPSAAVKPKLLDRPYRFDRNGTSILSRDEIVFARARSKDGLSPSDISSELWKDFGIRIDPSTLYRLFQRLDAGRHVRARGEK